MLDTLFWQMARRWEQPAFTDDSGAISNGGLLERAVAVADALPPASRTIGLTGPSTIGWVATYLGCLMARRTLVPIPAFFSAAQRQHIVADAGIDTMLSSERDWPRARHSRIATERDLARLRLVPGPEWQLVIYTSGTTGAPKGVRLGPRQLAASVQALVTAVRLRKEDRYVSLLPFSLLLEQITGLLIPLIAGIPCHIATQASAAALTGSLQPMLDAIDLANPSMTVLVPDLLEGWVAAQERRPNPPPAFLRFVAVGGAAVPPTLVARARAAGIPAYVGYGLSECCSVVAVNAPGADRSGSVGRCLPGRIVTIDDEEIIVAGAAVMDGYLGQEDVGHCWRTGDRGHMDRDGFLYVHGRVDNMLVTSRGRNISPEWIESLLAGDPRIARCVVTGNGLPTPKAVIVPTAAGARWFVTAGEDEILESLTAHCATAPAYARPGSFAVVSEQEFRDAGCVTPFGKPDRQAVQRRYGTAEAAAMLPFERKEVL
jgi:long-subunit acyl-CoA synthetase (AMP-forming)